MCSKVGEFNMSMSPVSFKGVYKVTIPKVTEAKNEQEKAAYTDLAMGVVVMGANASVAQPKVDAEQKSMYFKINDKNDEKFEAGFKNIVDNCNKQFNIDMAKKAYMEKVSEEEFAQAQAL